MGWPKQVRFKKQINDVPEGTIKEILVARMQMPVYSTEKNERGGFVDMVGVPDNRFMVMGQFKRVGEGYIMDEFYKVFDTEQDLHDAFEEIPLI